MLLQYFADLVSGRLTAMNLGWPSVFALLNVTYFGLHYMFASQTAHVGALYTAFLAMMLAAGMLYCCPCAHSEIKSETAFQGTPFGLLCPTRRDLQCRSHTCHA